jgi:hypothetical protein
MSGVTITYDESVQDGTVDIGRLDPKMQVLSRQLANWVGQARAVTNRSSLFDRTAYAAPDSVYEQMRIARKAVANDDIVGGLAEVTEALALQGVKWESDHADETDIFNQIAEQQNLDDVVRTMWREEYTYSQIVHAFWWDMGTFKVRGKSKKGVSRKKSYDIYYPRAISSLDSTKVVPVGMMVFNQENLAWQGTQAEIGQYDRVLDGSLMDEMMSRFYSGRYTPIDVEELQELTALGVDPMRLILLDPDVVRRHTLTKADHERFADLRLKRVFKLLDLKQQLMEADRVHLIGAANYILLVRKGTKEDPAYPEEITNLQQNFSLVAKLPVIFSDHRLEIDIITPKQDMVLNTDKYDNIDNRITQTLLGLFAAAGGKSGQSRDTALTTGRIVARGMENRRHMIRRYLEKEVARAIFEHPRNAGVFEGSVPNLTFTPRSVQLDQDMGTAQAIIQLRTMNEISRDSALEYFGFDEAVEVMRREFEEDMGWDDVFKTVVPFSSPGGQQPGSNSPGAGTAPVSQAVNGAKGGRPAGGGKPSQNPAKAVNRTSTGTTRPAPKG